MRGLNSLPERHQLLYYVDMFLSEARESAARVQSLERQVEYIARI